MLLLYYYLMHQVEIETRPEFLIHAIFQVDFHDLDNIIYHDILYLCASRIVGEENTNYIPAINYRNCGCVQLPARNQGVAF